MKRNELKICAIITASVFTIGFGIGAVVMVNRPLQSCNCVSVEMKPYTKGTPLISCSCGELVTELGKCARICESDTDTECIKYSTTDGCGSLNPLFHLYRYERTDPWLFLFFGLMFLLSLVLLCAACSITDPV